MADNSSAPSERSATDVTTAPPSSATGPTPVFDVGNIEDEELPTFDREESGASSCTSGTHSHTGSFTGEGASSSGSSFRSSNMVSGASSASSGRGGHRSRFVFGDPGNLKPPGVPPLTDICVRVIVENFVVNPVLSLLPRKYQAKVLNALPTTLPLAVSSPIIDDELFWKRASRERWDLCDISRHGDSWKELFFERHLCDVLETYTPTSMAVIDLVRTLRIAAPHVVKLSLRQLPSHLDLSLLLAHLTSLTQLYLEYGQRDMGMEFEWGVLGATLQDMRNLAAVMEHNTQLTVLVIQSSLLDDEMVRTLAVGLASNRGLTTLDVSSNKIGDDGAFALAETLANGSLLTALNLTDNSIGPVGAQALGRALVVNDVLLDLRLRLNRVGDAGGAALFEALMQNETLTRLDLAGNHLEIKAVNQAHEMISRNTTLVHLDLSSNKIRSKLGRHLRAGIQRNKSLLEIDLRYTDIEPEDEIAITETLTTNVADARRRAGYDDMLARL